MTTTKFESPEQLEQVFDCRYKANRPCDGACPLGVSREACEAAYFLGLEGRPALGSRIEIGDSVVETRETPEGFEVVEQLSQACIAVIREYDTQRGDDWDLPHCRATQAECSEHEERLTALGYLCRREDGEWKGYVDATDKGRAQYAYWTGEAR